MDRRTVTIALGAGIGAIVGVAITDVSHLTGYWPHVVVAIGAAARRDPGPSDFRSKIGLRGKVSPRCRYRIGRSGPPLMGPSNLIRPWQDAQSACGVWREPT
jgi:hypothetical protein